MNKEKFLQSLPFIQSDLKELSPEWEIVIERAFVENPWFTPAFTKRALHTIANTFFDQQVITNWLSTYPENKNPSKRIGLILAGNIPLVGFHDVLCVLASGNKAVIKLSEKDALLIPFLIERWSKFWPNIYQQIEFVEKVTNLDAVIATGTDAAARHFEYYFRNIPKLLRKNRNSIAVLTGSEREVELSALMEDIFLYFGLGCRNVSQVLVPKGYDFTKWKEIISPWDHLSEHNKYKNNLDYNYAMYIINQIPHIFFLPLILVKDDSVSSRIGSLHYLEYQNENELHDAIQKNNESIQCVVSVSPVNSWNHIFPGTSQSPPVGEYADGVDTMQFLADLNKSQ